MVIKTVAIAAILVLSVLAEEQPKWGGNFEPSNADYLSLESNDPIGQGSTASNDTSNGNELEKVIDTILISGRQGRNLDGFDEVYSDPSVQEVLQKGDDRQARNVIKDKLCSLGLMDCENEQIEGKRPFLPPGELIYSQPPPGYRKPNGPPNHYGQPKPLPPPNNNGNNFGPPRKVGYAYSPQQTFQTTQSFPGPVYHSKPPGPIYVESKPPGPFYEGPNPPGPIFQGGKPQIYEGPKPPGPIYSGDGSSPYKFENVVENYHHSHGKYEVANEFQGQAKPTIVVNAQGGAATTSGQSAAASTLNIHHHYHHIDEGASKTPVVVNNQIPVPAPQLVSGNGIGSSAEFSSNSGGFSPLSSGYEYNKYKQENSYSGNQFGSVNSGLGPVNGLSGNGVYGGGVKPVFEQSNSIGQTGFGSFDSGSSFGGNTQFGHSASGSYGGNGGSNTQYGQSTSGVYNGNSGSYHSNNPGYYKKALNTNGGANSLSYSQSGYKQQYAGQFGSSGNGDNYQGFESNRQDNFDCFCVPYDQCPSTDIIGRKDDLILPLDPRHLRTDIEAVDEETVTITDGNGTMTVVRVPKDTVDNKNSTNTNTTTDEVKKISKRDVSEKKDDAQEKADGEARLLGLGGISGGGYGGGYGGIGGKKVAPTFGVSFGLPYPTGGYPLNPYGGYPAQNPYFGSISPNGLNLGLVNVNPLVSFQLSKNEHGEKLFKPLVNLHVTPNEQLIHKVGDLFKAKKFGVQQALYNQHYHTHTHYPSPPEIYHPHHHPAPHYYDGPDFYPSGPNYGPSNFGGHGGGGGGGYGFSGYQGIYRDSSNGDASAGQSGYDGYSTGSGVDSYNNNNYNDNNNYNGNYYNNDYYSRSANVSIDAQPELPAFNYQNVYPQNQQLETKQLPNNYANNFGNYAANPSKDNQNAAKSVSFPTKRRRRSADSESGNDEILAETDDKIDAQKSVETDGRSNSVDKRQAFYQQRPQQCGPAQVCCRRPARQQKQNFGQCGRRNTQGITGRIKNPVYVDGDSEFGEYPWQVAILKKDPKESVYVCGGTLIDHQHILTAAHCVKTYTGHDLRIRLGEWDVNHDVEFFPYIERDVTHVIVHPEYYAGTLDNDLAILRLNVPVDFANAPHISPACLPDKFSDYTGQRCWTTGWGKDAFGDFGKYQNILKEVDVPIINQQQCQQQLRNTRLGYSYKLNPGFICAGGEEGKDACKGDGGGPMVCERNGSWQLVGVVSWGIGCGQVNVPGVYVRVSHYLDWIQHVTRGF
ncbi:uncharacterized protein LOC119080973 [Bradysia coprophila]|uniref:uncharacterized protein LOC119080973 n=1 Tax=Bradysia coprophila TaxID=38358 RepID=UPI00187DD5D7|nr:uncharacterized protein LOC119080973 [Bradysia coprophila]XP_037045512.1 uncharacterized protein LOC119080973 [Bradysia coprophila]